MPLELTELPIDLLAEALGHLSLRDLIAVARSNSQLRDGASDTRLTFASGFYESVMDDLDVVEQAPA